MDTRCDGCGTENNPNARFCTGCGRTLERRCAECGSPLAPDARFCSACGARAVERRRSERAATPEHPEERRQATVLFADLAGFTALSDGVDPELVKSVADTALARLAREVEARDGYVDKFIGDNVMAVFGAPVAHEDDPQRAIGAGLAMQAAMDEVNSSTPDHVPALELRVGINTGEVLAGNVGDAYTVIGSPVNLAARLEEASRPGAVTVGETTRRLAGDAYEFRALDPLDLHGVTADVQAFEAVGPAGEMPGPGDGPFVGRDSELRVLEAAISASATERRPHLATILGPAGIGKSRLSNALADRLTGDADDTLVLRGHCPAYGAEATLWAFREMFAAHFGTADGDDDRAALEAGLGRALAARNLEDGALIAERVASALAGPAEAPDEDGDAKLLRDRLFSGVRTVVEAIAADRPLVLTIDDLHWADDATLDLVEHLSQWTSGPVVVMCLARDGLLERRPRWSGGRRGATTIRLDPLDDARSAELVANLITEAGHTVDAEQIDRVARRSGGNPLFAEEMARRLRDVGEDAVSELPESVEAVLGARLDSLGRRERTVVRSAAVVGERFWPGALESMPGIGELDLEQALERLQELELIAPAPRSLLRDERQFAFRHELVQRVAYRRLPKSERARLHAAIGDYLDAASEGELASVAARHFARAREVGLEVGLDKEFLERTARDSLRTLERAGNIAAGLNSAGEAVALFEDALRLGEPADVDRLRIGERIADVALLSGHADTAESALEACLAPAAESGPEDEARVQRKLAAALTLLDREDEALAHQRTGIELLEGGDASIELSRLYGDAADLYLRRGDQMLAIYAAEKSLRIAEESGAPNATSRANRTFGRIFERAGDLERARSHYQAAVGQADESEPGEAIVALLTLGSHTEGADGPLEEASDAYRQTLALATSIGDVRAQIEAHAGLARVGVRRGDADTVESSTRAALDLATREGLTRMLCFADLTRGWLEWCDDDAKATRTLREAADGFAAQERHDLMFSALMLLGWVRSERRETEAADMMFKEALEICETAGLLPQSVEATAARAINMAGAGDREGGWRLAQEAESMARHFGAPASIAAAQEAAGAAIEGPEEGEAILREASESWRRLGRPVAAERASFLAAWRGLERDTAGALALLDRLAEGEAATSPIARQARDVSLAIRERDLPSNSSAD
jgi:class 3 adenylate cyclase